MTSMLDALKILQSRGVPLTAPSTVEDAERTRLGVEPDDIFVSPGPVSAEAEPDDCQSSEPQALDLTESLESAIQGVAVSASDDDTSDDDISDDDISTPEQAGVEVDQDSPQFVVTEQELHTNELSRHELNPLEIDSDTAAHFGLLDEHGDSTLTIQLADVTREAAKWVQDELEPSAASAVEAGSADQTASDTGAGDESATLVLQGEEDTPEEDTPPAPQDPSNATLVLDAVTQKQIAAAIAKSADARQPDVAQTSDHGSEDDRATPTFDDTMDAPVADELPHEEMQADELDAFGLMPDDCDPSLDDVFDDELDIEEALRRAVGNELVENPPSEEAGPLEIADVADIVEPPIETEATSDEHLFFHEEVHEETTWDPSTGAEESDSECLHERDDLVNGFPDGPVDTVAGPVELKLPEYPPSPESIEAMSGDAMVPPEAFIEIDGADDIQEPELVADHLLVEEPVLEEVVFEPMPEDSLLHEPVLQEPVLEEPELEESVLQEPKLEEPVLQEPKLEELLEEPVLPEVDDASESGDEPIEEERSAEFNTADAISAIDENIGEDANELRHDVADLKDQIGRLESLITQLLHRPVQTPTAILDSIESASQALGSADDLESPTAQAGDLVDVSPEEDEPYSEAAAPAPQQVEAIAAGTTAADASDELVNEILEVGSEAEQTPQGRSDYDNAWAESFVAEGDDESANLAELDSTMDEEDTWAAGKSSAAFFAPPSDEADAPEEEPDADPLSALKVVNPASPTDFASHFLGTDPAASSIVPAAPQFVDHLTTIDEDGSIRRGSPQGETGGAGDAMLDPAADQTNLSFADVGPSTKRPLGAPGPDPVATRERILAVLGADQSREVDAIVPDAESAGNSFASAADLRVTPEAPEAADENEHVMPETTGYEMVLQSNLDNSEIADQYRSLWKSCLEVDTGRQHLALTAFGCHDEPHVTQVMAQLAWMLAQRRSQRILLVDGNVISQTLSKAFHVTHRPGLAEIGGSSREWRECVVPTSAPNLSLIPCGLDIAQDFDESLIASCVEEWALDFDFVLIDGGFVGSPLMKPLVEFSNRSVIVVRLGKTRRDEASAALGAIKEMSLKTHGCIITNNDEFRQPTRETA